ncbi:HNH endonuclease [Flexivirga caeni]|nr:HNH endonuclease signature motif containing protein [Flexivirga caeni]
MDDTTGNSTGDGRAVFSTAVVSAFRERLTAPITVGSDTDLLAELRALEEVKNAISARQARITVHLHEQQTSRDVPRGIDAAETARLVGSQVALARRCSPHLGSRLLGLARAVVEEMPHTLAALSCGVISEWDATTLCRETACLTKEDRAVVDAGVADQLGVVSHRRLEATAREHAYRADPATITARRARAETQRRVTLRPAPDCMTQLTALLPVKDGVACYAALTTAVTESRADPGDDRSQGQVMADTLTERVTGRSRADGVDIQVNLLMPVDTLTGDTPAHLPGYGPIPADLARQLVDHPDTGKGKDTRKGSGTGTSKAVRVQVRRLFTHPGTGDLIGMESRARTYPGLLAHLIRLRDQTCRTPYCNGKIRHIDHIRSVATGGTTTERDGQGLCERCNYLKEHPDYTVTGDAGETTTSTGGLVATSHPPCPPGLPPPTHSYSERTLIDFIWVEGIYREAS